MLLMQLIFGSKEKPVVKVHFLCSTGRASFVKHAVPSCPDISAPLLQRLCSFVSAVLALCRTCCVSLHF